ARLLALPHGVRGGDRAARVVDRSRAAHLLRLRPRRCGASLPHRERSQHGRQGAAADDAPGGLNLPRTSDVWATLRGAVRTPSCAPLHARLRAERVPDGSVRMRRLPPDAGQALMASAVTARATSAIKQMVGDGTLKPGDRLPTGAELSERIGVSRTSLREAVGSEEHTPDLQPRFDP